MTGFSLTHVHLSCFVASYTVALLLELLRLMLRSPARILGTLGFTAAGILAQTIYIALRTSPNPEQASPLSGFWRGIDLGRSEFAARAIHGHDVL